MISIYKLTFSNKQTYIGQTTVLQRRLADHFRMCQNCSHDLHQIQALLDDGHILDKVEVLAVVKNKDAAEYEKHMIKECGSLNIQNRRKYNHRRLSPEQRLVLMNELKSGDYSSFTSKRTGINFMNRHKIKETVCLN